MWNVVFLPFVNVEVIFAMVPAPAPSSPRVSYPIASSLDEVRSKIPDTVALTSRICSSLIIGIS